MSIKGLSKNKVILSDKALLKLGFVKEETIKLLNGCMVIYSVAKRDSFVEIVNYYDEQKVFLQQVCNRRLIAEGVKDFTENEVKLMVKRLL